MKVIHLAKTPSILNKYLAQIRDKEIQKDSMRFRRNIERIGEFTAQEVSKTFKYKPVKVETPLGVKEVLLPDEKLVIASVLRAGLPLHYGLLNIFDDAENAFISAYRKHTSETDFDIVVEYLAVPPLDGKTLLLVDPMLATGRSIRAVYEVLLRHGTPGTVHVISVIAAPEGIAYLERHLPPDTYLWVADIDEGLNDKAYIVPGLGDAGDLAFGMKL
ncbi:MAG: uracil phosphoribosyltransferase [Chlorobi bacterium]|nr:uracil phosphoribosyltransferase [Chlorobiota bacterium]